MFWLFEVSLKSVVESLVFGSQSCVIFGLASGAFYGESSTARVLFAPLKYLITSRRVLTTLFTRTWDKIGSNLSWSPKKYQIPVNSWPRQVRPTCLCADKNLSTETNLQRSRGPATNQDLIGTTNKKCFSWDKVVDRISLFRCDWVVQSAYTGMNSGFRSNVPVFCGSDTDNSYDQHNGYRPGQYFWSRYQNHDAQLQQFPQNTFVPTAGLTRFKHPNHWLIVSVNTTLNQNMKILSGTSFKTTFVGKILGHFKCLSQVRPGPMLATAVNFLAWLLRRHVT